jgi:hypothetical protein
MSKFNLIYVRADGCAEVRSQLFDSPESAKGYASRDGSLMGKGNPSLDVVYIIIAGPTWEQVDVIRKSFIK